MGGPPRLVLEVERRATADDDRAALQLRWLRVTIGAGRSRRLPRVVLPHPLHQTHVAVRIRRSLRRRCAGTEETPYFMIHISKLAEKPRQLLETTIAAAELLRSLHMTVLKLWRCGTTGHWLGAGEGVSQECEFTSMREAQREAGATGAQAG